MAPPWILSVYQTWPLPAETKNGQSMQRCACEFISIKMRSYIFRYMDVDNTSEVNRNTKANTLKRIAE